MAFNSNSCVRPIPWDHAKKHRPSRILEDLQVYRIVTGQTNAEDYAAILDKYGWDAGKIADLDDNSKMGELARVLNQSRETKEYYATKSVVKKREDVEDVAPPKEKKRKKMNKQTYSVNSTPLDMDFPLPKTVTTPSLPSLVHSTSVFHHALGGTPSLGLVPYGEEEGVKEDNPVKESPLVKEDNPVKENPLVKEDNPVKENPLMTEKEEQEVRENPFVEEKEEQEVKENPLVEEKEEEKGNEEETPSDDEEVIEFSRDAPMAPILGPFCAVCGKFGQYVCDRTDEDVCSMECKRKAEARAMAATQPNAPSAPPDAIPSQLQPQDSQPLIGVSNSEQHVYLPAKHRFKSAVTILDSHKCPLCGRTGHLPQDCRYAAGHDIDVSDFQLGGEEKRQVLHCAEMPRWEAEELKRVYALCEKVQKDKKQCCAECGCRSNLAYCVECDSCFCDKFHLLRHLQAFPTHTRLYSFKLRRLLKCSNPRCAETDVYKLRMCNKCGSALYGKYYNMKTALWKRDAIRQYPSLICCEEHMTWHVMNCDGVEGMTPIIDRECMRNGHYAKSGIVNDMLF